MRVSTVLAYVNATHGMSYRLVGRLAGGIQSGAYELRDGQAGRAVLKWSTDRSWARQVLRAAPAVERARLAGWPTPPWLAVGVTPDGEPYQIQEYVDGESIGPIDPANVALLLDLVHSHEGLDPDPDRDWSEWVRDVVFGDRDHAREEARQVDPSAARLVDRFVELCADHREHRLPNADLVHGDLHPDNVLVSGRRIVAVIDVEAIGSGTRTVDLAGLLRTAYAQKAPPGVLAALRDAAAAPAGPAGLVLCTAAGFFAMTVFLARRDPPGLPSHYAATERLLDDLTAL